MRSLEADPQQLAWAVATVAAFDSAGELKQPASVDVLRAGLDALFLQQSEDGSFPRGQPLFHYPSAGNAYCYTFETLAELLLVALDWDGSKQLSRLLQAHTDALLRAVTNAEASYEELPSGGLAWSSRHHPHRTEPESWATAATFSFLQRARRLIGIWSADEARKVLGARAPKTPLPSAAVRLLAERGDTWPIKGWKVGDRIAALFVHPMWIRPELLEIDPDTPLIDEKHARSAILFGPPGTSKTTLVESVAGAIGWQFVEVREADFLTRGMGNVAARADEVFKLLMELDRCVVLFDEIDELLRSRTGDSDPFGRFLTTSMLPKLAELWEQRRVLFFANTNLIEEADSAIRRSQRFDAAMFVLPPSFQRKVARIRHLLSPEAMQELSETEIDASLRKNELGVPELIWLALIRWDQMDELVARLEPLAPASLIDLGAALSPLGRQLESSDWSTEDGDLNDRFELLETFDRHDYGKVRVLCVVGANGELAGYTRVAERDAGVYFAIPPRDEYHASLNVGGVEVENGGALTYTRQE
jgi:hypothetical protein